MDFEKLTQNLEELIDFVKPVGSLISDFYQAFTSKIPELGMLADTGKWILIIIVVLLLFYRLVSD